MFLLTSDKVTPLERFVIEVMPSKFTQSESKEIREKSNMLFFLHNFATGRYNYKIFKDNLKEANINLEKGLTTLGFDLTKEFTIDGKTFIYEQGELHYKKA